jgi:hypothetical protein
LRKRYLYALILFAVVFALTACSSDKLAGVYEIADSDEFLKPTVVLEENGKFRFTYSALSSYLAIGTFETDNNNLILKTDDGLYEYVFKIEGDSLIFNANESSELPSYANVPDGGVFSKKDT